MNISATKLLLGVSLLASAAVVACGDSEERSDGVGQPEVVLSGSSSGSVETGGPVGPASGGSTVTRGGTGAFGSAAGGGG